jgi:hypothetical protein
MQNKRRKEKIRTPVFFVRQFTAFPNKNEHFTKFNHYMLVSPFNFNCQTNL